MDFYHLQENIKNNYCIQDLKKKNQLVHKAGEFIGNQIVDTVTKSNSDNIEKQEPVKEIKKR